jgi:hypothetical protein
VCNAPEEDVKILILAPTLAFLDVALASLDAALLVGMLMPAAAIVAAILLLGRLASTPLPD